MILRLSAKLARKVHQSNLPLRPETTSPYLDWHATLFLIERYQHILVVNSQSLFSVVLHGAGITDTDRLYEAFMDQLRDMCQVEGGQLLYERLIVPHMGRMQVSKASDRSVIGSMNDMIRIAEHWPDVSPFDIALRLNKVPFSKIGMKYPREAFLAMKMGGDE